MNPESAANMPAPWALVCVECQRNFPASDPRMTCPCGGTLDVAAELPGVRGPGLAGRFDERLASRDALDRSGVWRFRELILPGAEAHMFPNGEGATNLYSVPPQLAAFVGLDGLGLKHEGENPTGSFKDRGMTAGITAARLHGAERVACASTGNTSASMAAYAAAAGMRAFVFVPEGKISLGKLSQALAYGARTVQIAGDFDAALSLVREVCERHGVYLLNSINPYRIEGQKAIVMELLQDRGWSVPDWIVLPGGNLGNSSALGKGLLELLRVGVIDRLPRIAVIQAEGASPFARAFRTGSPVEPMPAETLATAIRIGNPVSWRKAWHGVTATSGVVESVTDDEILRAKAAVDGSGIGAEPASCATVAGIKKLVAAGVIPADSDVVGILTGHVLKDTGLVLDYHLGGLGGAIATGVNPPVKSAANVDAVVEAMGL